MDFVAFPSEATALAAMVLCKYKYLAGSEVDFQMAKAEEREKYVPSIIGVNFSVEIRFYLSHSFIRPAV